MKKKGMFTGILLVLAVLLLFPTIVNEGSKEGLSLWFSVVLPALIPFMIFSGLMMRMGVVTAVGRLIYPIAHKLLGLSENGCYAFVIGWISGYPLGAKTAADLYLAGDISKAEAQYLLTFCNNASPMFLLEYMGVYCLGLGEPMAFVFVIYASALLGALFHKRKFQKNAKQKGNVVRASAGKKQYSFMGALDESILDSFVTVTKVGGYIILFSIMAQFIEKSGLLHGMVKLVGLGLIEITTGGEYIKAVSALVWQKWLLGCLFAAFGGLSSVAQTFSVIQKTDLSMGQYLAAKVWHCLLAVTLGTFVLILKGLV